MINISDFKNVLDLLDYFKDEATCKAYLEQKRWGGNVTCPECGNTKIYRTGGRFRCSDRKCDYKFSVKVGTIMEKSPIKLRYWFAAIYLISAHKKGISSYQMARDLGISQTTAWFLNHRIRTSLKNNDTTKFKTQVSSDETYVGGKNKNRHKDKKVPAAHGRSYKDKTPVLGLLEKDGKIRTFKLSDAGPSSLQPILEANIEEGATLMTDEWGGYSLAHKKFDHKQVKHSAKQYVDGMVHVNGVENYWSHLKRSITGTYHWVSVKHLERYCDEMTYRFNSREKTDIERFDFILSHVTGRLKYADLIYREAETKVPTEAENSEAGMKKYVVKSRPEDPTQFNSMNEYVKFQRHMKEVRKLDDKLDLYWRMNGNDANEEPK